MHSKTGLRYHRPIILALSLIGLWLSAPSTEAQDPGPYPQQFDRSNWMGLLSDRLADKTLRTIVIPGAHDASTAAISPISDLDGELPAWVQTVSYPPGLEKTVISNWSRAQAGSLTNLLSTGIRYFDFRIANRAATGTLHFVHTMYASEVDSGLGEVSAFLQTHPKEVVILDFQEFTGMAGRDHQKLANMIKTHLGPLLIEPAQGFSTFKDLSQSGKRVVVLYAREKGGEQCLGQNPSFWPRTQIPSSEASVPSSQTKIRSFWCNKTNVDDLHAGLERELTNPPEDELFVLQGVLTPDAGMIAKGLLAPPQIPAPVCVAALNPLPPRSLQDLAERHNGQILGWFTGQWRQKGINILMMDWVDASFTGDIIALNVGEAGWNERKIRRWTTEARQYEMCIDQAAFDTARAALNAAIDAVNAINNNINGIKKQIDEAQRALNGLRDKVNDERNKLNARIAAEIDRILPAQVPIAVVPDPTWSNPFRTKTIWGPNPLRTAARLDDLRRNLENQFGKALRDAEGEVHAAENKVSGWNNDLIKLGTDLAKAEAKRLQAAEIKKEAENALKKAQELNEKLQQALFDPETVLNSGKLLAGKLEGAKGWLAAHARPGDIVLGGNIANPSLGIWGHVAIVTDAEHEILYESNFDGPGTDKPGVRERSWEDFAKSFVHLALYRAHGMTPDNEKKIVEWVKAHRGVPYRFPVIEGVDKDMDNRMYCSQLVWVAYKRLLNVDLTPACGPIIHPDDLAISNELSRVAVVR